MAKYLVIVESPAKVKTIKKLDKVLEELYSNKCFVKEDAERYFTHKQELFELASEITKKLGLYVEVLDNVLSSYVSPWLSKGFSGETLLFIADYCFRKNKRTFELMDQTIKNLHKLGLITVQSITLYVEKFTKNDEFIEKFLNFAGVERKANSWDRENLENWRSWNFTDDMILEAAKLATGKSSPIAYVNAILSNWKKDGIFSTDAVSELAVTSSENTQEAYNREYERRRSLAHSRAQKNTEKAMAIEGFNTIYGRLYGMEKDLAFAEIANNLSALETLEKEKQRLTQKAGELLSSINLTLQDLSPRYACDKCHDTGYVGTHRCDCFDKKVD